MTQRAAQAPVPLVLIAGFLGSGKTSLLQRVLPRLTASGIVPHVVVNDYRNAWVDAQTLEGLARSVHAIHGTCVCCDSRDDLMNTLATLTLPERSAVLLEANGTADTAELIEVLTAEPRLRRFTLPVQVTTVDAKRWQKRMWHNRLEAGQARTASYLMLTRQDQVTETRWATVCADVTAVNTRAEWTSPDHLAERIARLVESADSLPARRFVSRLTLALAPPSPAGHHHADHHFASMELALPAVVQRSGLSAFLRELPDVVIRAKGVAVLEGNPPQPVLFQKVEGRDEPGLIPLKTSQPLAPAAILIGVSCPEETIRALAVRCFGSEPASIAAST